MSPILWGINILCILFLPGEDITDTITVLDPQGCDGEELDDDFVFDHDPDYQPGVSKVLLHWVTLYKQSKILSVYLHALQGYLSTNCICAPPLPIDIFDNCLR